MTRIITIAVFVLASCKPCERSCESYVELVLVAADPAGMFGSTAYDIVVTADGEVATCRIELGGAPATCTGDAEAAIGGFAAAESGGDESGGDPDADRPVMRWASTPTAFDVTVRDAAATLVFDNTLTPAYLEQPGEACGGDCRAISLELALTQ